MTDISTEDITKEGVKCLGSHCRHDEGYKDKTSKTIIILILTCFVQNLHIFAFSSNEDDSHDLEAEKKQKKQPFIIQYL